jgi:predicted lysophospholipase L1 biosynthesis ABC-type transport system permease subunit
LRGHGVAANFEDLQIAVIQAGGVTTPPNQWWVAIDEANAPAYVEGLPEEASISTRSGLAKELSEDPLRIAIQAALWLVTAAAAVLAALGFGVHAVVTVRAREIEFAQLRAVGIQRGALLRVVSSESALLSILGMVFGVGLGIALAYLVAPLVSVGPDGRAPIPPVDVVVPWATVGLLALEVVLVLIVTIAIVGVLLRRINPAQMLRLGDER